LWKVCFSFQRGSEHAQNYEKLVERDKKITEFLDSFPQEKTEALNQKTALQQSIVGLMQHISKGFMYGTGTDFIYSTWSWYF
jgi:hypothetical protein